MQSPKRHIFLSNTNFKNEKNANLKNAVCFRVLITRTLFDLRAVKKFFDNLIFISISR